MRELWCSAPPREKNSTPWSSGPRPPSKSTAGTRRPGQGGASSCVATPKRYTTKRRLPPSKGSGWSAGFLRSSRPFGCGFAPRTSRVDGSLEPAVASRGMPRFVFDFTEGNAGQRDLLGGKGAGLAEMTRIGLHVPPGFTVTTDACRAVMQSGVVPDGMWDEVAAAVKRLEESVGRRLGGGPVPLLLSVRSGAKFSMPGMMDTVLNLGMDDEVLADLISWSGDEHFAWDAYRRFVQMFAKVVRGMDAAPFEE